MFNFTPKSDEVLLNLLEKGDGQFEVIDAAYHTKNTNTTLRLTLKVWDIHGNDKVISDYLSKNAEWKIKDFCYSCGLETEYDTGGLSPEICVGKSGKLKLDIKHDDGYQPKNTVAAYIRVKVGEKQEKSKYVPESEAPNDDIPF